MKATLKFWAALLCAGLVIGGCCDDLIATEIPGNEDENPPVEKPDDETPDEPIEKPLTDGNLFTIQLNDVIMATVGTDNWTDIKYGNGRYVAISQKDRYYGAAYSSDGLTWNQISSDLETGGRIFPADGLKFINKLYFVMSGTGSFLYSTNGSIWNRVAEIYIPKAYFKNKYYCVGSSSVWYTQTSSISSTQLEGKDLSELGISGAANTCDAEVYNDKLFLCTDQGDLVSSTDGTNFTLIGRDFPKQGQFILGDGILVLVGRSSSFSDDDSVYYTTDGATWKKGNGCTLYQGPDDGRISVDYYNGLFIAYRRNSRYNKKFYYSLDGMNWASADLSEISDFNCCCLSRHS